MSRCVGRYKFGHDFYRESVGPMPIWLHKTNCLGDEVSRARVGEQAAGGREACRRREGRLATVAASCVLELIISCAKRNGRAELLACRNAEQLACSTRVCCARKHGCNH